MKCRAALLTPPTPAGIAVIGIVGRESTAILEKIFKPQQKRITIPLPADRPILGKICDDAGDVVDQVIVTHDPQTQRAEISCHGGPRIVQRLLLLLQKQGVEITTWQHLQHARSIAQEVALTLPHATTRMAVTAIAAQHPTGLTAAITAIIDALQNPPNNLDNARQQIAHLLASYELAVKLLHPPIVVLTGPVNSGKSTLANALTGQQQSITADLPGTTRDWTTQLADVNGLPVHLVDTAGKRSTNELIEQRALAQADVQLAQADLVILVLEADGSEPRQRDEQMDILTRPSPNQKVPPASRRKVPLASRRKVPLASRRKVPLASRRQTSRPGSARFSSSVSWQAEPLVIANKCDLPRSTKPLDNCLYVSALTSANLESLRRAIAQRLGFADFNPTAPLAFTQRQYDLLQQTTQTPTTDQIVQILQKVIEQK